MDRIYSLVEIFRSLQGEGRNMGRPCVFVRFAGCNLACPWCDTDVNARFTLSLPELVAEIKSHDCESVILTGGEPTCVEGMGELIAALKQPPTPPHAPRPTPHEPPTTNHEPPTTNHAPRPTPHEPPTTNHEPRTTNHEPRTTNHEPPTTNHEPRTTNFWLAVETNGTNDVAWLKEVDYVACSPKQEYAERLRLTRADEVRVVASSEAVVGFCRAVRAQIAATDYYVSPCDHDGEIDFATAKSVLAHLPGWSLSVQLHKLLGFR